jgi:signal transduction histidine kinase
VKVGFRTRLFIILSLFAVVPAAVLTIIAGGAIVDVLRTVSSGAAWERAGRTGSEVVAIAREKRLTPAESTRVEAHEHELEASVRAASRFRFIGQGLPTLIVIIALVGVLVLAALASSVSGHLSRQLSRPLQELVGWTEQIARNEPLPPGPPRRGAPEFEMLRQRMRRMAREIAQGRARELEAERLRAFRETARQVAHELKNPLTPIRFAVDRLKQEAPPALRETVEVLVIESRRLEEMARSFAQFGRLPEGPASDIEIGELVRYSATATVPTSLALTVDIEENLPMLRGHHDALARALSNVLINAVDACRDGGAITVGAHRAMMANGPAIEISVRDTGCGIAAEHLSRIWEPYVTSKTGGTGLGLAIARQTITAHGGEVSATSAMGEGTDIRITLPVNDVAAAAPVEVSADA